MEENDNTQVVLQFNLNPFKELAKLQIIRENLESELNIASEYKDKFSLDSLMKMKQEKDKKQDASFKKDSRTKAQQEYGLIRSKQIAEAEQLMNAYNKSGLENIVSYVPMASTYSKIGQADLLELAGRKKEAKAMRTAAGLNAGVDLFTLGTGIKYPLPTVYGISGALVGGNIGKKIGGERGELAGSFIGGIGGAVLPGIYNLGELILLRRAFNKELNRAASNIKPPIIRDWNDSRINYAVDPFLDIDYPFSTINYNRIKNDVDLFRLRITTPGNKTGLTGEEQMELNLTKLATTKPKTTEQTVLANRWRRFVRQPQDKRTRISFKETFSPEEEKLLLDLHSKGYLNAYAGEVESLLDITPASPSKWSVEAADPSVRLLFESPVYKGVSKYPVVKSHEAHHLAYTPTEPIPDGIIDSTKIKLSTYDYLTHSNATEVAARGNQFKNFLRFKNPDQKITKKDWEYLKKHYIEETGFDNNISDLFNAVDESKLDEFLEWLNKHSFTIGVLGTGTYKLSLPESKKLGGKIKKFGGGGQQEVSTRAGKRKVGSFVKLKGENFWRRVNSDGTLTQVYDGSNGTYDYKNKGVPDKVMKDVKWHKALYTTIDPLNDYPNGIISGLSHRIRVKNKMDSENIDRMSYTISDRISTKVADAAWRKYNGIPYNEEFLPKGGEDRRGGFKHTVRLPKELELEIPVDTNFIKQRIDANQKYVDEHPYDTPVSVKTALESDKKTLKALRKTYATGLPVGVSEFSYNSRNWGTSGDFDISPLNVLANYNIRYSPEENRMYYSDTYGFDNDNSWYTSLIGGYDKYLDGNPFRIRGYVDLNDSK